MTLLSNLGRFTVRKVNIFDAPEILRLFGNEDVVRYLGVRRITSIEAAGELIQRYVLSPTQWLAVLDGNDFLGVVGLEVNDHHATMLIAFNGTGKARGAGREFSKPFVDYIFRHPSIWRVSAYCHVDNIPVQRVLDRMGARCEARLHRFGIFPNVSSEPQDVYLYAIVREI
jgi:RimJ/RimL family protein N-acetyltransferase